MTPFGRYLLLEKLAVGGMAEVWLARSADGGKPIVLKRILPQFATDPEFVARFREEAEISLLLVHGNIVPVFEVGTVGEDAYIAMEYLPGVDLRSVLRKVREDGAKVPPGIAAWIIAEVLRGLDYAHRKGDDRGAALGLVHRDVSPSNVVVSREGAVKLLDFGIAKAIGREATRTGVLRGKVGYMSPEQARGDSLGPGSDLFSAAVVLYELLTSEKLFDGESEAAILERVKSAPIPYVRDKRPEIPAGLDAVVAKALQRDPSLRFGNAAEFLDALCRVLYGGELPVVDAAAASAWIRGLFPAGEGSTGIEADHRTATRAPAGASQIGPGAALMLGGGSMPVSAAARPSRAPLWAIGGAMLGVAVALALVPTLRPITPAFVPGVSTVVVQSSVPGSTILVDNVDSGQTPTVLTLSRAQHRILVRHDGYQDIEKTVEVGMAPLEENFRQEAVRRKISFTSQPPGAAITVEGHGFCNAPCELDGFLPDETFVVSAEKPLFRSANAKVIVAEIHGPYFLRLDPLAVASVRTPTPESVTSSSPTPTLTPVLAPGTASFAARPWGVLSIDNGPQSTTPLQRISLSPGRHNLQVLNEAFGVKLDCPFEVRSGRSRPLAVIFVDQKVPVCPDVESPPSN